MPIKKIIIKLAIALDKIERLLKIERCYNCGKCIWWKKTRLRYIEDIKNNGFVGPACSNCINYAKEHQNKWKN
jgi:bacterioferritin-associated ferredoxin